MMTNKPETITELRGYIKSMLRQRKELAGRYGSGVRPSHVSADLAVLDARLDRHEANLKVLEAQNGKIG
jgi:hypothetical protein